MEANDIIFYINKDDWREENKACLFKDFDTNTMNKIEADYDMINFWFRKDYGDNWQNKNISIRYKDEPNNISHLIKWESFDPRKMILAEEKRFINEINLKNILESGKAPGLIERTNKDRGSIMHRGKIDEGAVEDLLDKSLPKAESRAKERNTNIGHSFTKNDTNKVLLRRK